MSLMKKYMIILIDKVVIWKIKYIIMIKVLGNVM